MILSQQQLLVNIGSEIGLSYGAYFTNIGMSK